MLLQEKLIFKDKYPKRKRILIIPKKKSQHIKRIHKKNTKTDQFSVNHKLYVLLLFCFFLITVFCLFIPQDCSLFTVGTGIGCGGLASIIIAWLIDVSNASKFRKRAKDNREVLFKKFDDCFENGIQILILSMKQYLQNDNPRKWFEWIEGAIKLLEIHPELYNNYKNIIIVFFNNIEEQLYGILSQSVLLLEYGIITKKEIDSLRVILTISQTVIIESRSKTEGKELLKTISLYCKIIKKVIGYSPVLKHINEKIVEPQKI